ncbi:MAG: hypothetical protein KHW65_11065 [Clostridiales bacterium]|nr:hypothetical protein [Clostridiales bacterium]
MTQQSDCFLQSKVCTVCTMKLLREWDADAKMGDASIDNLLGQVHSDALKDNLTECKKHRYKRLNSDK